MIRNLATRFKSSPFFRNILSLSLSTVIAQGILVLVSPILSRIFTPAEFGLFGVFTAVGSVAGIAATGRYELALVKARNHHEAVGIYYLTLGVIVCFSVAVAVPVWLASARIGGWLGLTPEQARILGYLPLYIGSIGLFQTQCYWCNRLKRFDRLSASRVFRAVVRVAVMIGGGLLGFGGSALIVAAILGELAGAFFLFVRSRTRDPEGFTATGVNVTHVRAMAAEHRQFPMYGMPNAVLNAASRGLPQVMLAGLFSPVITGLYEFSMRIGAMPISILGYAIGQVFYQRISEMYNQGLAIGGLVRRAYWTLFKIGVVPLGILAVFAPPLFRIFFGPDWVEAGRYTQLLSPWLLGMFMNSPLMFVIPVLDKQRTLLIFEVILLLFRAGAIYTGYLLFDSGYWAVLLFSAVSTVYQVILMVYVLRISSRTNGD